MKVSRRTFLEILGGSAAGAGAAALTYEKFLSSLGDLERWSRGDEKWTTAVCDLCSGGCGVLVRSVDGNVVKLRGNPAHPVNRGGLCSRGQAGLQLLYNPDRIKGPLKRRGKKGSEDFVEITWEEAVADIASRLGGIRGNKTGPKGLVYLSGGPQRSYRAVLAKRFCEVYGTPNYISVNLSDADRASLGYYLMHGHSDAVAYDLENAGFILSFGCNFLESWINPVYGAYASAKMRTENPGRRGRLVYADPRYSLTAGKADKWLPVKPGTDGALALGIANVLIQEGLVDEDYLKRYTFGYFDWTDKEGSHQGFRSRVLKKYNVATVSDITGIPVEDILMTARGFGKNTPAIAIGGGDVYTQMAVHSLNALVGSFGKKGTLGIQKAPPCAALPEPELDTVARENLKAERIDGAGEGRWFLEREAVGRLPERFALKEPYPVEALFLDKANPVYSRPDGERFKEAILHIPLVVSFSSFIDETAALADYVLPDHTYLEKWQDDSVSYVGGAAVFSVGSPSAKPLFNTKDTSEVLIQTAKALGGNIAGSFPWKSYKYVIEEAAKGLLESKTGYVLSDPETEMFRSVLTEQGFHAEEEKSFKGFWKKLYKRGVWANSDLPYQYSRTNFATPSGKFEFYSNTLKKKFESAVAARARANGLARKRAVEELLKEAGISASGDEIFFPHFDLKERKPPEDYPLVLNPYKLSTFTPEGPNLPILQEIMAPHIPVKWTNWVEISRKTAEEHGIEDGDAVTVSSARGSLTLPAVVLDGLRPEVVNIPLGQGHTHLGRWAKGRGANPLKLVSEERGLTYVRISRTSHWR